MMDKIKEKKEKAAAWASKKKGDAAKWAQEKKEKYVTQEVRDKVNNAKEKVKAKAVQAKLALKAARDKQKLKSVGLHQFSYAGFGAKPNVVVLATAETTFEKGAFRVRDADRLNPYRSNSRGANPKGDLEIFKRYNLINSSYVRPEGAEPEEPRDPFEMLARFDAQDKQVTHKVLIGDGTNYMAYDEKNGAHPACLGFSYTDTKIPALFEKHEALIRDHAVTSATRAENQDKFVMAGCAASMTGKPGIKPISALVAVSLHPALAGKGLIPGTQVKYHMFTGESKSFTKPEGFVIQNYPMAILPLYISSCVGESACSAPTVEYGRVIFVPADVKDLQKYYYQENSATMSSCLWNASQETEPIDLRLVWSAMKLGVGLRNGAASKHAELSKDISGLFDDKLRKQVPGVGECEDDDDVLAEALDAAIVAPVEAPVDDEPVGVAMDAAVVDAAVVDAAVVDAGAEDAGAAAATDCCAPNDADDANGLNGFVLEPQHCPPQDEEPL